MHDSLPYPSTEALLSEQGWMRSLALALVRDADVADDLVQEAVLAALRRRPSGEHSLRPWLGTVVRNLARKRFASDAHRTRREAARAALDSGASCPSPEELTSQLELQGVVVECLKELEEPFRSTLLLRFFEEQSPSEIARATGTPAGTVRWRLSKGLESLRERLDARHAGDRAAWSHGLLPLLRPERASLAGVGVAAPSLVALPMLLKALLVLVPAALVALALRAPDIEGRTAPTDTGPPPEAQGSEPQRTAEAATSTPGPERRAQLPRAPGPVATGAAGEAAKPLAVDAPRGRLRGVVQNSQGRALAYVDVLHENEASGATHQARTDGSGRFEFVDLELGVHALELDESSLPPRTVGAQGKRTGAWEPDDDGTLDPGYYQCSVALSAEQPEAEVILRAFELGEVFGRVVTFRGEAVEHAIVMLTPSGDKAPPSPRPDTFSDADGYFQMDARPGLYRAVVQTPAVVKPEQRGLGRPVPVEVEVAPGGIHDLGPLVLGSPGGTAVGRLIDQHARPIADFPVVAFPDGKLAGSARSFNSSDSVARVTTDAEGRFELTDLPPQRLNVSFSSGYHPRGPGGNRLAGYRDHEQIGPLSIGERVDLGTLRLVVSEPFHMRGAIHYHSGQAPVAFVVPLDPPESIEGIADRALDRLFRPLVHFANGLERVDGFESVQECAFGPLEFFVWRNQVDVDERWRRPLVEALPDPSARSLEASKHPLTLMTVRHLSHGIPLSLLREILIDTRPDLRQVVAPRPNSEGDPEEVVLRLPG